MLVAAIAALSRPAAADDRPETEHLIVAGAGMAIPTYFLGVALHEGSHALAAKWTGAEVREVHLLPGVRHGKFYFGYVRVRGLTGRGPRSLFFLAPKLVDLIMLGSYSGLVLTDTLPSNHYGQLALAVWATGFWVDFAKDIPAFWDHNDTVKLYNIQGWTSEWQRLPARLLHLGLSVGAGYVVWRGYQNVFEHDTDAATAFIAPLLSTRF